MHCSTKSRRSIPAIVAVGYRLTPENCRDLLAELAAKVAATRPERRRPGSLAARSRASPSPRIPGLFQMTFASGDVQAGRRRLPARRADARRHPGTPPPQTLADRIRWKAPYPLLRHHFGRPTVDETVAGVVDIARAECLDVLSLGTDQNAQEHFFRPAEMDPNAHGAGGVPVRTEDDLAMIYAHTRLGNYPLMRCYSGTRDTMQVGADAGQDHQQRLVRHPAVLVHAARWPQSAPAARGDPRNASPDALARRTTAFPSR